jgi:hypothetical protein
MIYLAPFKIEDYDDILPRLRAEDALAIQAFDKNEFRERLIAMSDDCPIASFNTDNGVAAIGGAVKVWEGVASWWMLTSPLVRKYPKSFQKSCRDGITFMMEAYSLHRLEAAIPERHFVSQKWAESHGFVNEGLMRGHGPDGANHFRYARVEL